MSSEETKSTVEINGVEYNLVKTGRDQAEQIAKFSAWLSAYAFSALSDVAEKRAENEAEVGTENYLTNILSNLSADSLLELFSIVIGCNKKVSEEYFDFGVLVDSVLVFWDKQTGIQKLVNRFFSTTT